jgi:hypothetical protein
MFDTCKSEQSLILYSEIYEATLFFIEKYCVILTVQSLFYFDVKWQLLIHVDQ